MGSMALSNNNQSSNKNPEELKVGGKYYVSFNGRTFHEVKVLAFVSEQARVMVEIVTGSRQGDCHTLNAHAVRSTIDAAKRNYVSH